MNYPVHMCIYIYTHIYIYILGKMTEFHLKLVLKLVLRNITFLPNVLAYKLLKNLSSQVHSFTVIRECCFAKSILQTCVKYSGYE